jgi:hypothetical protein
MDIEKNIRKLARSSTWQNLFEVSKNNSGIRLFENDCNFSAIQLRFLYWASTYSMLYSELMTKEDKFLSEQVLLDDDRADAYLIRRNKKHEALWEKYRREEVEREIKAQHPKNHKSGKMNVIDVELIRP